MLQATSSAWLFRVRGVAARAAIATADAWRVSGVRRGLVATSMIALGSYSPAFTPDNSPWLQYLPWLGTSQAWQLVATVLTLVGALLLIDAWFQIRPRLHMIRPDLRVVVALWALPFLLGPPIFSQDSYALAAEGWMLHNDANPYEQGVGMMPGPFAEQTVLVWRYTIAPYGPLSLRISEVVVALFGFDPYWSATLGMRLVSILGVGVMIACLPALARRFGADPDQAIWFAVANPLAITHLIGGAHNDAWMLGLIVLALWLAMKHQFLLACLCVAAATAIKLPAVIIAVPVALIALPPPTTGTVWRRKFHGIVVVSIGSALTLLAGWAISMACALGWGWIEGLRVPGIVVSMAPWTALGELVGLLLNDLGHYDLGRRMGRIFRETGVAITILAILVLFYRWLLRKPTNFAAAAMAAITFGSPSLHPWYLTWPATLLPLSDASLLVRRLATLAITLGMYASVILMCYFHGALLLGIVSFIPFIWLAWVNDRIQLRREQLTPVVPAVRVGAH